MPSVEPATSAFASAIRAPARDVRIAPQGGEQTAEKGFSSLLDESTARNDDLPARPQSKHSEDRQRRDAVGSNAAARRPADSTDAPVESDGNADAPVVAANPDAQAEPAVELSEAPAAQTDDATTIEGDAPVVDSESSGSDPAVMIAAMIVPVAPPPVATVATPTIAVSVDAPVADDGSIDATSLSSAAAVAAPTTADAEIARPADAKTVQPADAKVAQAATGEPSKAEAPATASVAPVPQAAVANPAQNPAPDPTAKPAAPPSNGKSEPATAQPVQGVAPTEVEAKSEDKSDAVNPATSEQDAAPTQNAKMSATAPADERSTPAPQAPAAAHHANAHPGLEALQPLTATPQSAAMAAASASPTQQAAATVPMSGLAVEIATRALGGSSRFEIRLDPPDLGRIDVRLDVDRHGNVTSHLMVERSETLDLLRRDAPNLERALQDAGLKTGDSALQFSLRDQRSGGDRDGRDTRLPELPDVVAPANETESIVQAVRSYRWSGATSGIDIRV